MSIAKKEDVPAATGAPPGMPAMPAEMVYHIVESKKSFEATAEALPKAVVAGKFGVLGVHDIGDTLRKKGQTQFTEQCKVFEVCNPAKAAAVLAEDMRLNFALPCRVSVYTEGGVTKVGMIRPSTMLAMMAPGEALLPVANEVEEVMKVAIAAAAAPEEEEATLTASAEEKK